MSYCKSNLRFSLYETLNFCIHTFKFNFKLYTHTPIKLLQSRTKYNARGVYLQIPKTKKNETGLLLRIAYLVPIFRLPLDELMALCKKRLSTTHTTSCQGVQCCSRVQLFTYETKRS